MKNPINRTFEVLTFLLSTKSSSKIIHAAITGDYSINKISNTLSDLKRRGFADYDNGVWEITESGRGYFDKYTKYKYFDSSFTKKSKKDLLVVFDIPEKDRSKRDWFRYQLKKFYYVQIQQSVWHGPSPLPKDFISYLKEIDIRDNIKMFRVNGKL